MQLLPAQVPPTMDFLNPGAAAERLNLRIRQLVLESSSAPSPPPLPEGLGSRDGLGVDQSLWQSEPSIVAILPFHFMSPAVEAVSLQGAALKPTHRRPQPQKARPLLHVPHAWALHPWHPPGSDQPPGELQERQSAPTHESNTSGCDWSGI